MFDDTLKAAYKQWVTQMFTATNPYTGIPLAQDPALAVIEIQNEDNFLWWWDPNRLPEPQLQSLETKFGAYLIAKYGSIAAAQANWARGTHWPMTTRPMAAWGCCGPSL